MVSSCHERPPGKKISEHTRHPLSLSLSDELWRRTLRTLSVHVQCSNYFDCGNDITRCVKIDPRTYTNDGNEAKQPQSKCSVK